MMICAPVDLRKIRDLVQTLYDVVIKIPELFLCKKAIRHLRFAVADVVC